MFDHDKLHSIGDVVAAGVYRCLDCNTDVDLQTETRLPPCPRARSEAHQLNAWLLRQDYAARPSGAEAMEQQS